MERGEDDEHHRTPHFHETIDHALGRVLGCAPVAERNERARLTRSCSPASPTAATRCDDHRVVVGRGEVEGDARADLAHGAQRDAGGLELLVEHAAQQTGEAALDGRVVAGQVVPGPPAPICTASCMAGRKGRFRRRGWTSRIRRTTASCQLIRERFHACKFKQNMSLLRNLGSGFS